jgi:hypothetical protein
MSIGAERVEPDDSRRADRNRGPVLALWLDGLATVGRPPVRLDGRLDDLMVTNLSVWASRAWA